MKKVHKVESITASGLEATTILGDNDDLILILL